MPQVHSTCSTSCFIRSSLPFTGLYSMSQSTKPSCAKSIYQCCQGLETIIIPIHSPSFLFPPQAPISLPPFPFSLFCPLLLPLPSPSQILSSLSFSPLRSTTPYIQLRGLGEYCTWAPPAGSGAEPQPKSNLVHFSVNTWHLVATILTILLRMNSSNLVLEMREILVMRRVSGRWLQNAGVSREMRETW